MGIYWALGHMITAGIIAVALYIFRETILQSLLGYFGIFVSIALMTPLLKVKPEKIWHYVNFGAVV